VTFLLDCDGQASVLRRRGAGSGLPQLARALAGRGEAIGVPERVKFERYRTLMESQHMVSSALWKTRQITRLLLDDQVQDSFAERVVRRWEPQVKRFLRDTPG